MQAAAQMYLDASRGHLARRTRQGYATKLEALLRWMPDGALLEELDRATLRAWQAHLLASDRQVVTVRKYVDAILAFWRWADDELGETETVQRPPSRVRLSVPQRLPPVSPTWAQMDACVEQLTATSRRRHRAPAWLARLGILLRYTGARPGALLQVDWSDVDLVEGVLTLRPEITKGGYGGRRLPMSPHLVDAMAGWGVREGWVVPCPEKERLAVQGATWTRDDGSVARYRGKHQLYISRAWARAEVPEPVWKRAPCKAFRRGMTSLLTAAGAHVEAVEYLVGHGVRGTRGAYLDRQAALWDHAVAAVGMIPAVGETTNVRAMARGEDS